MGKFLKNLVVIFLAVFIPVSLLAQTKRVTRKFIPCNRDIVNIRASIQHISDIDFVKLEYKMELWLSFNSPDSLTLKNIENQITIQGAKEMTVDTIPSWRGNRAITNKGTRFSKELKIKCTMIENWDLYGYPFDKQVLDIIIYNAARINYCFKLMPKDSVINYNTDHLQKTIEIENGWVFTRNSAILEKSDTIVHDPFNRKLIDSSGCRNDTLKISYSAVHFSIPVWREHRWLLFFKLLIGMYVAFFVAFISLYVNINEAQSRFDLPVGGLFAAIANKYIMESIMPQSPRFSLVDWLHSLTIIFILIIIAYSARLLFKFKAASGGDLEGLLKNDNRDIWIILVSYILFNTLSIVWACFFHHS
ncbi:MAG TPA: hypothetical protein VFG10_07650 [Saprospiraceae bacterium]|nr:hypothetical protein [Saprospiraceae bacterium]